MEVLRELPASSPPSAVAIGVFDGVHLGHREIISRLTHHAQEKYLLSTVLTFEPHPAKLLRPESAPQLLTSIDDKLEIFESLGVERTAVMEFNDAVASVTPEQFAKEFLANSLSARSVIVGDDFHFGSSRQGNVATLQEAGKELGFSVDSVELVGLAAAPEPISSTAIRRALAGGRVKEVARMMGRLYSITGEVIVGDKRGRTIGFPTANLPVSQDRAWPADGVYAGWFTDQPKVRRPCAINIGRRPTFYRHAEHSILEAHLLDFDGDLYGQIVEVEFVDFLRSEKRFSGIEELKEQLTKDIARCRAILVGWESQEGATDSQTASEPGSDSGATDNQPGATDNNTSDSDV